MNDVQMWSELTPDQRDRYLAWGYGAPSGPGSASAATADSPGRTRLRRLAALSVAGTWIVGALYLVSLVIGVGLSLAGVQVR